ncbi:MAG: ATP citrate lyase b-subunit [Microgenomates group bacterium GW2011_GWA2_46_16]|nr:MAG: ATP citrate lyase b-subunit [Microgenomates group bacterium GW2011_GWA2_46_16]
MARVKLTEYDAKRLLLPSLNQSFTGFSASPKTTIQELSSHFPGANLVVKLDQGIKKRGNRGLVRVNCTPNNVVDSIKEWAKDGWTHFLAEPVIEHASEAEHYLSLERMRGGWQVSYGDKGGIEVESNWDSVKRTVLRSEGLTLKEVSSPTDIFRGREGQTLKDILIPLISALEKYHLVFLECNPILIRDHKIIPLDMAAEIDDTALGLPEISAYNIVPVGARHASPAEVAIAKLDATTPASLKFRLINPRGSIWMLLSGGGASLVLADEVADQGMGTDLANYGEYSGAPTDDDVYVYTKIILTQLLSTMCHKPCAIIIAGGVANFTDIAKTFRGLIKALDEKKSVLRKDQVKVFVRRGGPSEEKGLQMMSKFLEPSGLLGSIHGHATPLTEVVSEVKQYLSPARSDFKGSAQPDIKIQSGGKVRP